jgi:glyoxylase-like metal-dependent hydrolase (beta-lactamase superfamily II)
VKPFFIGARPPLQNATPGSFRSRLTFRGDHTVPLHGHTPGHQGFRIHRGTRASSGDAIHHASFQVARPDWSPVYDVDPQKAAQTRKRVLDRASTDRLLVAGMHLPFPAFGHVACAGDGYRFILAEWPYAH